MPLLQCSSISLASVAGRRMAQRVTTFRPACLVETLSAGHTSRSVGRHQVVPRYLVSPQVAAMTPTRWETRLFHTAPSRWTTQAGSATMVENSGGIISQETEEPIQGTASLYDRHLLICTGLPSKKWPKKPELSDPYLNLLTNAVRSQNIKVNLTDVATVGGSISSSAAGSKEGSRHDIVLFPDNVKFCQLSAQSFRDLGRFLAGHPIGTLRPFLEKWMAHQGQSSQVPRRTTIELVGGVPESEVEIELVPEKSAILVCTHGARDCRCGDRGGEMQRILKDMVDQTGLSSAIKIYGVSHIGGHKHAPNTIMYPSGDWHGNLSEHDSVDAQQIVFEALSAGSKDPETLRTSEPILLDKWRGRLGMSQDQQRQYYQEILARQEAQAQETTHEFSDQGLFAAPGEDLYQDDGLLPDVDSELKHLEQKEQLQKTHEGASTAEALSPERVNIVFESFQKVRTPIQAKVGERILDIVKDKDDPSRHDVYQALECTCGGQLECATCHVYIESPFYERLPPVTDAEEDMLEYAIGRKAHSRLGCQIRIKPEHEGMVVKLPQY